MNPNESRYPCLPPADGLSVVVLLGCDEYTASVANENTRLHEIRSAGDQEALKLRAERLGFICCCSGDLPRKRSALRERLPGGSLCFVASRLSVQRQLFGRLPIQSHQLDELAFKIFSERDIRGFQVLTQLGCQLPRSCKILH